MKVQIKKIKKLVDYLGSNKSLSELVIFLGANVCLSGEICKVYIGEVESNGIISHLANFGYKENELSSLLSINLKECRPICDAVNSNSMIIAKKSPFYYEQYQDITHFTDPWITIVCIPLLPNYAVILTLQTLVEPTSEKSDYYDLVHSLLSFYLGVSLHGEKQSETINFDTSMLKGKPLTFRQQVILDMMKNRMTNREIAEKIHYSESLVRQETIVIFAKLGFSGRRDLKDQMLLKMTAEQ